MATKKRVGRPIKADKDKVKDRALSARKEDYDYIEEVALSEDRSKRSVLASMCREHKEKHDV